MKKFFTTTVFCIWVLALTGCEAGLTQNDNSEKDEGFSFSEIYSNMSILQGEISDLNASSWTSGSGGNTISWNNGNVGIGTSTPASTLDINGDINIQNIAAGKTVTAPGWAGSPGRVPGALSNIIDGNENTATTEGITHGVGNIGRVTIDLGSVFRGIVYIKMGIRMSNGGSGQWQVESSVDNANWLTCWDTGHVPQSTTETVKYIALPFWGRYISCKAIDPGYGQVVLKVYEVYAKPYH
ncbi:MAG: discoidin domain-containing protein [bacterium]|nr:discoidin domain-containing protein [bacterium]